MSHANRLTLREVKGVFHLLGEITELGTEPRAWRTHMLCGLARLCDARVALTVDLKNALPGLPPEPIDPVAIGFVGRRQSEAYAEYCASDERACDPSTVAIENAHRRLRLLVMRREQLVDSTTWYASPMTSEARRASDVDDLLIATARFDRAGWLTGFALYRDWGQRHFCERERNIVRLFFIELQRKLAFAGSRDPAGPLNLPPHLRQTLRLLLHGASAKEIAQSQNLSTHTVNSYTKLLYRRLGINSRGELTAWFAHRPGGRPIFLPAEFDAVASTLRPRI